MYRSIDHGRTWLTGAAAARSRSTRATPAPVGFAENDGALARSRRRRRHLAAVAAGPFGCIGVPHLVPVRQRHAVGDDDSRRRRAQRAMCGATWQVATGVPEGQLVPVEGMPRAPLRRDRWRRRDDGATWQRTSLAARLLPRRSCRCPPRATAWADACGGAVPQHRRRRHLVAPCAPCAADGFRDAFVQPLGDGRGHCCSASDGPWLDRRPATRRATAATTLPAITGAGPAAGPARRGRAAAGAWATTDTGAHLAYRRRPWRPFGHVAQPHAGSRTADPAPRHAARRGRRDDRRSPVAVDR